MEPWLRSKKDLSMVTGFTLIELVIVVAIMTIVFSWGLIVTADFYRQVSFRGERDTLVSLLRRARSKALANVNESDHGLAVATSTYVLFQGSSYAGRTPQYDEVFARSSGILVGGISEVVFQSLGAGANASGSITMTDPPRNATITLNYEGRISW